MNNNLISVILPVYNGEKYVEDAIKSVLSQNYEPLEIIVVNDGSTDGSEKVLKNFENHITYIKQENGGPPQARNTGLEHAKGNFITFIDQDDVWHPDKLRTQLHFFVLQQDLEITIGFSVKHPFQIINDIGSEILQKNSRFDLLLGSSLMKKTAFEKVGSFDNDLLSGDDTDWFLRAREEKVPICVHRDLVLYHRLHDQNFTKKVSRANYVLKTLKKVKDRKKISGNEHAGSLMKPENMEAMISLWHTID